MTNTKKSLLTSALSMLLCVAMLLGTTFAWFTDSATNTGNRILAGNLEVDLLRHNGVIYESIKDDEGDIFDVTDTEADRVAQNVNEDTIWEPGKTQIVYLAVENDGNLALKYEIMLNVTDYGLADALEYAIFDGKQASDDLKSYGQWNNLKTVATATGNVVAGITMAAPNGKLLKGKTDYFALAVHMKEDAGNDFMNKEIIIDVAVNATQVDEEADSFDTIYDKGIAFDDSNRAKLPARAAAKVKIDTNTNTVAEETVLTNNENVTVTVPAGVSIDSSAVNEDGEAELVLNITRTEVPANITIEDDEVATSVEINIEGIADTNDEVIVIDVKGMFAKNLNNVKMYHNDDEMNKKNSRAAVVAHDDFYYDPATGDVTIAVTNFSPFTMTYDVASLDLGFELPKAIVAEIDPVEVEVDGGAYMLDKAYSFKTTQEPEEVEGLPYEHWFADFVISCDKDVAEGSLGIAGYYKEWCDAANNGNWLGFIAPEDIKAGTAIRLLKSYPINIKYIELCEFVKEFKCGAFDIDGQNKGTTMTVELRLYERVFDEKYKENDYETGNSYLVGSFNYTF